MYERVTARVWRFIHNVVAHPLLEVLPAHWGAILHDATAMKAFGNRPHTAND